MKNRIPMWFFCLFVNANILGQVIDFTAPVSFIYQGETLENVLTDIEYRYGVKFSYSSDLLPLDQKMFARIEEQECKEAFDILFEQTQIVYGIVGKQVVLGIDTQKVAIAPDQGLFGIAEMDEAWASRNMDLLNSTRRTSSAIPVLHVQNRFRPLQNPGRRYVIEMTHGDLNSREHLTIFDRIERRETSPVAHFSLVYPVGYRTSEEENRPTNIGLHLTWGHDPSVNGVILAGLGSTVEDKMEGIQLSSFFNAVGGEMEGAQFTGLVNMNFRETRGVSASGIMNYAESMKGAQLAGILNISPGLSTGFQGAGVCNIATRGWGVSQAAGIFNISRGVGDLQAAGIFNIGDEVRVGQIGGIFNIARKVNGFQIGLINIADTVSGPTIGLINLVKKGYHSFEISGQESIHANAMLRIGTKPFYNILRIGARIDERTWALGYGIGTSIPMGRRNSLQIEAICSHVNDRTFWTDQLNLLNQLNLVANFKIGRHVGLALGPVFNVSVSKVYHADQDRYGMALGSNYLFDETSYRSWRKPVNVRGWVGFHAGIRIESR